MAIAGSAQAQQYGPPGGGGGYYRQPGIQRYGLVAGFGIGGGELGLSDCDGCGSWGTLALQAEIGGMVAPNIAILFDYTGAVHSFGGGDSLTNTLLDGAVRFFFGRIFWLEGGIGVGELDYNYSDGSFDTSGWGLGLMGAFGVEALQARRFALDVSLRIAGERISTNPTESIGSVNILVGFHWY